MELKDGILILINLAVLGTVIAAAVYIFQIGNKNRSVSCGAVDLFQQGTNDCSTAKGAGQVNPCTNVTTWGTPKKGDNITFLCQDKTCKCSDGRSGILANWAANLGVPCQYDFDTGTINSPCGAGYCSPN